MVGQLNRRHHAVQAQLWHEAVSSCEWCATLPKMDNRNNGNEACYDYIFELQMVFHVG